EEVGRLAARFEGRQGKRTWGGRELLVCFSPDFCPAVLRAGSPACYNRADSTRRASTHSAQRTGVTTARPPVKLRRVAVVAKQPKGELVPVVVGFNYDLLEAKVAERVRSSADRIRERVRKTVEDIIEVGRDLLAAKEALEHGQFGPWLKAEFGWSERTAQNF